MLPVTVLLVWRRTRFMRLSRITQVGIAVVSVMTAVAMLIWVLTELLTGVL